MKVQCDVCEASSASIFCCADEAALCDSCDRRVHRANKVAGKHRRLSLLHPSPSQQPPRCDICRESTGFLFCKEDRAILCRECDVRVHSASELTRRHGRFLLNGVRVSSAPAPAPAEEEEKSSSGGGDVPCHAETAGGATASGSSISEYLTKTLPGWHVEDFFLDDDDAAAAAPSGAPFQQGWPVAQNDDDDAAAAGALQEGYPPPPPAWTRRE